MFLQWRNPSSPEDQFLCGVCRQRKSASHLRSNERRFVLQPVRHSFQAAPLLINARLCFSQCDHSSTRREHVHAM